MKKDPLGSIETWEYNPQINQKIHTDLMGLKTIETYNIFDQLSSHEKGKDGKTLSLEKKFYNKNGQLLLQIDTVYDPKGSQRDVTTRWEYDCRGLLRALVEADETQDVKITQYTYTPRKELAAVTKPNGVVLTYKYNEYGHLESLTSSDGSVAHKMKYNLLGHLHESDGLSRKTDPFGRIQQETFPKGFSVLNTYDRRGQRDTCAIPEADCLIGYGRSAAHLETVTRKTLDGSVLYQHSYSGHDLSGNVLSEQRIDLEETRFMIDPLNRIVGVSSFPFRQEIVEFDRVGNILKMRKGSLGDLEYTYDDLYQLTSEKGHNYVFDSLNNRLQKDAEIYQINSLNQITSHIEYDPNGNPAQLNGLRFKYDALDRLIRIEGPDFIQTFTYDFLHRCLLKTTEQRGEKSTRYFLYDGQNEIGSFDEMGRASELRILGNTPHAEIGASIAIELNGKIHVPIHDLEGNLAVLKPLDSIPMFYHYSAFGEEVICGETIAPWRFSSKRTDPLSELVYFGRRFYVPSFGRWLTPDPVGFTSGMNLYAYVHNNRRCSPPAFGGR